MTRNGPEQLQHEWQLIERFAEFADVEAHAVRSFSTQFAESALP
jgi:hypothetical protein